MPKPLSKHASKGTRVRQLSPLPTVIGEGSFGVTEQFVRGSDPAHKFARINKRRRTPAEKRFEEILNSLSNGLLVGMFETQWPICAKWILDFYFPRYRLAIEVDGGYHDTPEQKERDKDKAADCKKLGITLCRLQNEEIFGDESKLIWRVTQFLIFAADRVRRLNLERAPLSKRDRALLDKHFAFYKSLATGARKPDTEEQKHFVLVCRGELAPRTEHELAFARFIRRNSKKR